MIYKKIEIKEMEHFWSLLNALDAETNFMMYEPNERKQHMDIQELETDIYHNVIHGNDFLQIAKVDNKIVGYLRAERGEFHRNFHTAYIVVGVLNEYQGKGIGTTFFENLEKWAKANAVIRLELTVECHNEAARKLYEKSGFKVEGIRAKSMLVNGEFVDEYYMAKIL